MDLPAALAFSHYATAALAAHPRAAEQLAATLDAPYVWTAAEAELAARVAAGNGAALDVALRELRRQVLLHTIARDLTGRADLAEVCGAMTRLAQSTLSAAVALHHADLVATYGMPCGADGAPQQLVVIGMGKLGGGELNVSSDIDLVFTYPEDGETAGARGIANREFFDRLGRRVIGALNDRTPDGFVFRVDMRLRPYGDSGPLTAPFAALEQYLVTQGRAWERYAWLKARFLTGTRHHELDQVVTPFVYRKYLDFDAYEGLRDIHRQIRAQGRAARLPAEHQARPGRNPRDRIHRAGAPTRSRRARARPASARHAPRARRALCPRPDTRNRDHRVAKRLRVPAQCRASAAISRRPADPGVARRGCRTRGVGPGDGFCRHGRVRGGTRRPSRQRARTIHRGIRRARAAGTCDRR